MHGSKGYCAVLENVMFSYETSIVFLSPIWIAFSSFTLKFTNKIYKCKDKGTEIDKFCTTVPTKLCLKKHFW